jgi:hypothetical protein
MSESIAAWLTTAGAQRDIVAWAESFGHDWDALWAACPRGDWLLAIAVRRGADDAAITSAARAVAALALDHVEGEERTELALALREPSEARARSIEARAETTHDPVHQAALTAVALAVRGGRDDAAMVPAFVMQAAAMDAADCGMSAAVSYAQRRSAELVREVIARAP